MADVTLKLTLGNFSVEVTGPAEYAEKKLEELVNKYVGAGRQLPPEEKRLPVKTEKAGKKLTATEFLKQVAHKTQYERAMVLGYYLEQMKAQESFLTTEVGQLGREAKRPFGNISDIVSKLVSRGLMMSAGDKEGQRAYTLTASGEEYVESMPEAKS